MWGRKKCERWGSKKNWGWGRGGLGLGLGGLGQVLGLGQSGSGGSKALLKPSAGARKRGSIGPENF